MDNDFNLEKQWQKSVLRLTNKELLKIFPESRSYLQNKLQENLKKIEKLRNVIKQALLHIEITKTNEFTDWFRTEIIRTWFGENYNQLIKEAKKLAWLLKPPTEKKEEITLYMIERAKEYPMRDLIEINRNQMAICPFHKERHASFYCRNNYYFCFACGETGDTIKFVMKTQGLNFKEAVKYLQ